MRDVLPTRDVLAELWPNIRRDDTGIATPIVLRGVAGELGFEEEDVRAILAGYAADAGIMRNPCLRCYKAGTIEPRIEREIVRSPPQPGESLARWANAIFRCDDFTIVLNDADRWALPLTRFVASMIEPSHAYIDRPRAKLELVVMLGRYRATPLGIHQDPPGTDAVLFHIGPGRTRMTLYDPADYARSQAIVSVAQRAHSLVSCARVFEIDAGDVLFLPTGYFHVGQALAFSTTIACKHALQ